MMYQVDAMRKNDADGVAVCEAHEDPEIFRLRLGKCLNFEVRLQIIDTGGADSTYRSSTR